uniref:RING-type domain-containing protein n=1 Tax=Minutocellus polymorphus TaxID=265543 RepID=A0A7S0AVC8_9STRA|mmetsp:Transcript_4871/g.8316  ORF Transcript_4871/g.8316 Transcript_4871/m.8316 type:complete len:295 (+) Transcript_4871:156-1040(+)
MGKKGKKSKKAQEGKQKKLTPKDIGKRLDALVKKLEEELKGADLFAPLPPMEDCAICCIRMPRRNDRSFYQACCGKIICAGCYKENEEFVEKQNEQKKKPTILTCPFCRAPAPFSEEYVRRLEARASQNDPNALHCLASVYLNGDGVPKDELRGLDFYIRAIEHGSAAACNRIAYHYHTALMLPVNKNRCDIFQRVGALRGCIIARHCIGVDEYNSGNHEVGIRHWKVAAEAGCQISLDALKKIFNADGKRPGKMFISKDYMDRVYRACHEAQEEVKSEEREKHRIDVDDEFKC